MAEAPYVCQFSPEVQKKALEELNEEPGDRQSHLDAFRQWVKDQPHFTCRTDDAFLLQFLRVAKFSQLKARERLNHYLTGRCDPANAAWFAPGKTLPDDCMRALDKGIITATPGRLAEGPFLIIFRAKNWDPKECSIDAVVQLYTAIVEIQMLIDDENQVHGLMHLEDYEGFTMGHVTSMNLSFMKRITKVMINGMPIRQKGSHYFNTPTIVNGLFDMAKLFLTEKLIKRLHFHKSHVTSLHKEVPKSMLPDHLGGDVGPHSNLIDYTRSLLLKHGDQLERNAAMAVDESKRPLSGAPTSGVLGSFRKLSVD